MYLVRRMILVVLFTTPLVAQKVDLNLMKIEYGRDHAFTTARSMSLAGAAIAGGDAFMAALQNPALATRAQGMLSASAGFGFYKLEEDRAYPYYDNFGGFVDYGSYYFNKAWYQNAYGLVSARLPFSFLKHAGFTFGYTPFKDFNYDYFEEVRGEDFDDTLLAYNVFNSNGTLYSVPLAFAYEPLRDKGILDYFSLGVGLRLLTGDIEQNWRIESKDPVVAALAYETNLSRSLDNTPIIASLGLDYQLFKRLSGALVYSFPYAIKFQTDTLGVNAGGYKHELFYPAEIKIGFSYRFQNILAARLFTTYEYTFWSEFEDVRLSEKPFDDTYTIKAGVEHIFFNNVPFRLGFHFGSLRESRDYTQTILTIGTGMHIGRIEIDLAGGISGLDFYQDDLYDDGDYGKDSRNSSDRVNWQELYGHLDVHYSFR